MRANIFLRDHHVHCEEWIGEEMDTWKFTQKIEIHIKKNTMAECYQIEKNVSELK